MSKLDPYEVDQESFELREVYAHFGQAVYLAQCFEASLAILIILARKMSGDIASNEQHDIEEERLSKKTLGQITVELGKLQNVQLRDSTIDNMQQCLRNRNRLCHRYWHEVYEDGIPPSIATRAGRERMLQNLGEMTDLFRTTSGHIDKLVMKILEKGGIDRNWIDNEMKRFLGNSSL